MNDHDSRRELVIYGEGKVSAEPNAMDIHCSVQAENPLITTAVSQQSVKIRTLLARISTLKVPSKDITTLGYGWHKHNDYNRETQENVFKGWVVTQRLCIRASLVNSALIIERVADLIEVEHVIFVVKEADALREQASQLAIKDAQEKGLRRAEQLEVALGRVLYFVESHHGAMPPIPMIRTRGAVALAQAGAPELPPGETEIQATVTVVFEIE